MKERLDILLVSKGLATSREKAKAVIMAGLVFVNGQREDKAGSTFDDKEAIIEVRGNTLKYVSRGGLKLEKALPAFGIDLDKKSMYGYRSIYRRLHRLYAAKRCGKGLFHRCGSWAA